jgi:flagellar hook-associated protein 2
MSVGSALSSSGTSGTSSVNTSATANSPVSITGLASGINTSSIIAKLTQAEQNQVTEIQDQQTSLQSQQQIYQQIGSELQSMSTAGQTLATYGAFDLISGTSSNTAVASLTTGASSTAGSYNLSVSQLAQAQKLSSSAQASSTAALGLSPGTFIINGSAVQVAASDSLTTIAQKINSLNNGATASIIDGGQGSAYLTLTASNTGTSNQIQMADLSGNTLSTLGLTSGAPVISDPQTNGALSYTFSSSTQSLSNLMGLPSSGTYSFSINGGSAITVNPATDTLQSVANDINAAGGGVSATVNTVTNGSTTGYQLSITSPSGTTFTDSNGLLAGLGVLQAPAGNQLVQAQNASYSLDGVNLTSASNTITSAIPGSTLTLLEGGTTTAGVTTPVTSTLSLSQNTSSIVSNVNSFVSAFNAVTDYINSNSGFDSTTDASGALFGDPVAQQVQTSMSNMIFANVPGTTGAYTNLASIGFEFDSSGDLTVDSTQLTTALQTDPNAVNALFQTTGSGSTANLAFLGSTTNSVATGAGSYAVNITQPATQEVYTAGTAQTSANTGTEDLTFSGAAIGSKAYTIELPTGATLASTIAQINSDPTLKNSVVASDQNGYLSLQSQIFGAGGNFTVLSSSAAGSDTSGVGTSGGAYTYGTNVQGTINGEAATGSGQYLTGSAGNATTDGLEIQYTGTATGEIGSVSFNNGIAVQAESLANSLTNSTTGALTTAENSLSTQITDLGNQITQDNTDLANQTSSLQAEFATMETAIETAKQQSAQLSSLTDQTTTATGISI